MLVVNYIVRGRVQGVGFRWFVEREANALGLKGWVRNREDGTVEVLAMGEEGQLGDLRRKLQQGPRGSRVDEVEENAAEGRADAQQMQRFEIKGVW
jgi:acylphosphatase